MIYTTDFIPLQLNLIGAHPIYFDIETTGFSPRQAYIYLIGAGVCHNGGYQIHQWLAQNPSEEKEILTAFTEFSRSYDTLVHFNGEAFDLPFVNKRCEHLNLVHHLHGLKSIDLYKRISPYKNVLKLLNVKQKSMEHFLGINRKDPYHGGELIPMYYEYVKTQDEELKNRLLLHNYDDMKGLAQIGVMDNYRLLFEGAEGMKVVSCTLQDSGELIFHITLPFSLPVTISNGVWPYYLTASGSSLKVAVHTLQGELKYFYENYKDYYYLPTEDYAIHKSIATYVEKSHRRKATADTCYAKRSGLFLPQQTDLFQPVFSASKKEAQKYFECSEAFLTDPEQQAAYIASVLIWQKGLSR